MWDNDIDLERVRDEEFNRMLWRRIEEILVAVIFAASLIIIGAQYGNRANRVQVAPVSVR